MERIWVWSRQLFLAVIALCALGAVGAAQAQDAGPPKIGYVSLDRILRDSAPAKAAQAKLDAEFSDRQKELADMGARLRRLYDDLEKNAAVMPEAERARRQKELADQDKDFQRRQREFNEDVNQRHNEELQSIVEKANKVIRQIAENEHYDMIFQEAVYFNPRVDITDKVLKGLNSAQSAASATPAGK